MAWVGDWTRTLRIDDWLTYDVHIDDLNYNNLLTSSIFGLVNRGLKCPRAATDLGS